MVVFGMGGVLGGGARRWRVVRGAGPPVVVVAGVVLVAALAPWAPVQLAGVVVLALWVVVPAWAPPPAGAAGADDPAWRGRTRVLVRQLRRDVRRMPRGRLVLDIPSRQWLLVVTRCGVLTLCSVDEREMRARRGDPAAPVVITGYALAFLGLTVGPPVRREIFLDVEGDFPRIPRRRSVSILLRPADITDRGALEKELLDRRAQITRAVIGGSHR